jgi:hypothetical protein
MDNLQEYFRVQLRVASASSLRIERGQPGIQCLGFPATDGQPPLVVVWDEDQRNTGASATNCIHAVLEHLQALWAGRLPVSEALVVERDSAGDFDYAVIEWSPCGGGPAQVTNVGWSPLRWPGVKPRSAGAFEALFGARARATLQALH